MQIVYLWHGLIKACVLQQRSAYIENMLKESLYTLGVAAMVATAMGAEWETDFDTAKERAAAEGKAIIMNFTGSDWCGYCIRMKHSVLSTPEFEEYVKDKFVLMEIDIPRSKPVAAEEMQQRRELCKQYDVTGFPTIAITDAKGEVLGGFSGARPDVESTKIFLDNALVRRTMLAEARKLQGTERAKALMEVYESYPKTFRKAATALRNEIMQSDPNDETGLVQVAVAEAQMQELSDELAKHYRNYLAMTEIFDEYIAKAHPLNKERMMERKRDSVVFPCVNLMLRNAKNVEDVLKARDYVLKEAETSYPDHMKAEMIKALQEQFADPEALLKKVQGKK